MRRYTAEHGLQNAGARAKPKQQHAQGCWDLHALTQSRAHRPPRASGGWHAHRPWPASIAHSAAVAAQKCAGWRLFCFIWRRALGGRRACITNIKTACTGHGSARGSSGTPQKRAATAPAAASPPSRMPGPLPPLLLVLVLLRAPAHARTNAADTHARARQHSSSALTHCCTARARPPAQRQHQWGVRPRLPENCPARACCGKKGCMRACLHKSQGGGRAAAGVGAKQFKGA